MSRGLWIGLIFGGAAGLGLAWTWQVPEARGQRVAEARATKAREELEWEFKVGVFTYNPGERLTDEQRAAFYERTLNDQSRKGWETVGSLMTRNVVQTVGGAVTTRDSTSFVVYRRPRR